MGSRRHCEAAKVARTVSGKPLVSEPKTTPNKRNVQVVYGIFVGVLVSLLSFYKVPYPLLLPIVIGNMAYAIYRIKTGSR